MPLLGVDEPLVGATEHICDLSARTTLSRLITITAGLVRGRHKLCVCALAAPRSAAGHASATVREFGMNTSGSGPPTVWSVATSAASTTLTQKTETNPCANLPLRRHSRVFSHSLGHKRISSPNRSIGGCGHSNRRLADEKFALW
jgi:hypothetical protein